MFLEVFLSGAETGALPGPLVVGSNVSFPLVARPAETTYQTATGQASLVRYGLREHAFCGRIVDVGPRGSRQEILLDCGVPVTLLEDVPAWRQDPREGLIVTDLAAQQARAVTPESKGLFLYGLLLLSGDVLEHTRLAVPVVGRIVSLRLVDLRSGTQPLESLPSVDVFHRELPLGVQGVLVGIES